MDKNKKKFLIDILEQAFGDSGEFKIHEVFLGHMNDIYKISYKDQTFGFRVRTHEPLTNIFGQRLMKEVFATWLLNKKDSSVSYQELQRNFINIKQMQNGENISHYITSDIIFFSKPTKNFPYSCTLYKWIEGECLWKLDSPQKERFYKKAGGTLAQIHSVRLDSFYENIDAICSGEKQNWLEKYTKQMNLYLQRAEKSLPKTLLEKIKIYIKELDLQPINKHACLVHNDFSGGNIIVSKNSTRIIDWDVWEVNRFEADLISQKYFTKIDNNQKLTPDKKYYDSFLEGYFAEIPELASNFNDAIFRAEEIKWLLRLFLYFSNARSEISKEKEIKTTSFISLYPSPDFFVNCMERLVE